MLTTRRPYLIDPENNLDMTERSSITSSFINNRFIVRAQNAVSAVKWNLVLGYYFLIVHFCWFTLNFIPEDVIPESRQIFLGFQQFFSSLGFLLIRRDEVINFAPVFVLLLIQLFLSLWLFWGIGTNISRILDQWILVSGMLTLLNSLYHLYTLFNPPLTFYDEPWTLVKFVSTMISYYLFNGLYIWCIYNTRDEMLYLGKCPDFIDDRNSCKCCLYPGRKCLNFSAAIQIGIFIALLWITYTSQFVFYSDERKESALNFVLFIMSGTGIFLSVIMIVGNNRRSLKSITIWMHFQVFISLLVYGLLVGKVVEGNPGGINYEITEQGKLIRINTHLTENHFLDKIILDFVLVESPLVILIWFAFARTQEIRFKEQKFLGSMNELDVIVRSVVTHF